LPSTEGPVAGPSHEEIGFGGAIGFDGAIGFGTDGTNVGSDAGDEVGKPTDGDSDAVGEDDEEGVDVLC
jgi:hypothetical protein